jgi:NAD+ kinase
LGGNLKVGVVSRIDKKDALQVAEVVIKHLSAKGLDVVVETETAVALGKSEKRSDLNDLDADFLVTIGGDGTILRAAMEIKEPSTPLLGINMGRRGFLTEVERDDAIDALDRVIKGDYNIEESLKLSSRIKGMDEVFPDALNEVLVSSSLPSKMILIRISVNGEKITEIQADGCIISTPTGSTAYNLSAGGSIISPELETIMVTAVCPYSYFSSIAIPSDSFITIDLLKPGTESMAIIDGRSYSALKPFSTVKVWKSSNKVKFIRFNSFYSRLRKRLTFLQSQ